MTPDPRKLAISEHQRWLGYLQPDGLVVSPLALVDSQVQLDTGNYAATQERLIDSLATDPATGCLVIGHFAFFARGFLGWKDELLSIFSVSAEVPDGLSISTGEHGEILQPDAAYKHLHPSDPAKPWILVVRQLEAGTPLDEVPDGKKDHGWIATPHQKFERLLRETGVPIGILCNGHSIRLCYAPKAPRPPRLGVSLQILRHSGIESQPYRPCPQKRNLLPAAPRRRRLSLNPLPRTMLCSTAWPPSSNRPAATSSGR